jgi:hypothetical protein
MVDRRRSFPRGGGRHSRRPGHRSAGTPTQMTDIRSWRIHRWGHGRLRSAARHHRRSPHAGNRQTAGRTTHGCIRRGLRRHDYHRHGCRRHGSNHRGRRRYHGCIRRRSRGPRRGACRPHPGRATTRHRIRRQRRRASRRSRLESRSARLRSRLGRRPLRATRRRTRLDPHNRRPVRRTDHSHPSRQSLLGVRNRQSHGPRHRWGVRAHHRRCRAPARCRLQPLKPPPERIIPSPYPQQTPSPTPPTGLTHPRFLLLSGYNKARELSWKKSSQYAWFSLPARKLSKVF